ncbi:hypothetical protein [Hyalangium sp.]|uniref:monooxygenase n=1 Tax=Hyalangium sp. TaxID=2028555 RepID=UPI002D2D35C4|nr:hypothetical protein [Hyalangium sp.]HYI01877.1 hypothetical protein [Hyalangium sp.]
MKRRLAVLVVLGALAALAGCGLSDGPGTGAPDAGGVPDGGGDGGTQTDREVTWYRDVLPIVQARCQECHVTGGIAPFALTTYADAKAMHTSMASAATTRRMPPWMPEDSCRSYVGSRRLSQAEIDTLAAWSSADAPEGSPADAPPPPTASGGLPWVDVTLDAGGDYTPTSVPTDDYRCFVVDPGLTQDRDVIGYDILPGVRSQVHHVILYVATKAQAQSKDGSEAGLGWTCYGGPGTSSSKMLGGWVPGSGATRFPAGTGIRLKAGEVIVLQVHYNTSQQLARPDRTVTKLQYSQQPVPSVATFVALGQGQFSIPPRATGYSASNTLVAAANARVYGVLPHMHTLGKSIRVENTSKGQCYIDIPRWDFHWQQLYFFTQPLQVSAQNSLKLTCTWDNYTDRTVTWGEGTADEMCLNYFYVTVP